MGRLVLVSNRVADMGQSAQAGGVAVALAENLRKLGGLWLGWDGTIADDAGDAPQLVEFPGNVTIATTPLTPNEHKQYYLGYSNSVLWPVLHNRLDLAQFEAGFYSQYIEVNKRFARLLAPLLEPEDVIWVHDYHFITFADELRRLGATNPIGFYLHIPFAPSQAFLALPEHREIARAFSNYDFIGFQTTADVAQFIDSMRQGVGGQILQDGRIRIFDRAVSVGSNPVSIDVAEFIPASATQRASAPPAPTKPARLIGIDRLDYTKGLPHKFRAYRRFLEKYPAYRGKVVLAQIAPPTRESLEAYSDIRVELETLAGSINGQFGDLDWVPIQYIHRARPRPSLRAVYKSSKVGLVTPLKDGMNLVAKEYVASQDPADPGVLILSRFAGAAEELEGALIVNPYDMEEVADAISEALNMNLEDRKSRHGEMLSRITRHDTFAWCGQFLAALDSARGRDPAGPPGQAGSLRLDLEPKGAFNRSNLVPEKKVFEPEGGPAAAGASVSRRPLKGLTGPHNRTGKYDAYRANSTTH